MERHTQPEHLPLSPLSKNIKFLRKLKGISQQKLANETGLKRNNIASYEAGIVEPKADSFLKLARFFGVNPSDLITLDLSVHPLEYFQESREIVEEDNITDSLELFIAKTNDLQKVLEGFVEFHKFRRQEQAQSSDALQSLNNDFDNLLSTMESLLQANWAFIQSIQREH